MNGKTMNVNLSISSLPNQIFELIQTRIGNSLTPLQRKATVIALAILACCAVSFCFYRRLKTDKTPVLIAKKQNELDHPESLLSVTTKPEFANANDRFGDRTYYREDVALKLISNNNLSMRMEVVAALGGLDACRKIPIVSFKGETSAEMDQLDLFEDFPKGHAVVQGEDLIGRKIVILRLQNKKNKEIFTRRIFQRYREIGQVYNPINEWVVKDSKGSYSTNTNYGKALFKDLENIIKGTDPDFALYPLE
jgi:hypothetical protein